MKNLSGFNFNSFLSYDLTALYKSAIIIVVKYYSSTHGSKDPEG